MATRVRQTIRESTGPPSQAGNLLLPPYGPPSFSLTPDAQRELRSLKNAHNFQKLNAALDRARESIQTCAGEINDRLADQERAGRKHQDCALRQDADDNSNGESDVSLHLIQLRGQVQGMTQRMDESIRRIIDSQHGVQHMQESIDATARHATEVASTQASQPPVRRSRRLRNGEGGTERSATEDAEDEGDANDPEPFDPTAPGTQPQVSAFNDFKQKLDDAKTRYQSASLTDRYAEHDHYRDFKRVVHDALYPDDDHPLPHHSKWFPEDGAEAAPGMTRVTRRNAAEDEDSDDDIAVSKATISTKCPLTLQEFKQPVTSKKCPHSFEKVAIYDMIRLSTLRDGAQPGPRGALVGGEKAVVCPLPGCGMKLSANDLHEDVALIRKIARLQRARQLAEDDDDEDDDGNGGTQQNATVLEDDGDSDGAAEIDEVMRKQEMKRRMKLEPMGTGNRAPISTARSAVVDLDGSTDGDEDTEMYDA